MAARQRRLDVMRRCHLRKSRVQRQHDHYDGNSLRVKKVSGGTTTVSGFSGAKAIAERVCGAAGK